MDFNKRLDERPFAPTVVKEKRSEIIWAFEDMMAQIILSNVEDQTKAIAKAVQGIRLENGEFVTDTITDMLLSTAGLAFDAGYRFGGAIHKIVNECDALPQEDGQG